MTMRVTAEQNTENQRIWKYTAALQHPGQLPTRLHLWRAHRVEGSHHQSHIHMCQDASRRILAFICDASAIIQD